MTRAATMKALSAVRDTLHGAAAPSFMRDVLATGVGPKIVGGTPTDALAIHFVVKKKLAPSALDHSAAIPRQIAGYATDVVDGTQGELRMPDAHRSTVGSPRGLGYGTPLLTETGAWGTAACAARAQDGRPLLVTSAHVVALDEAVYDGGTEPPVRLGRCSGRLPTATRHDLYGDRGSALDGQHLVDVAVIAVETSLTRTAHPLAPQLFAPPLDTAAIDEWLLATTPLVAWGAASQVWRRGSVVFYWPRRTADDRYGLCLIQQEPMSEPGDSGSLWLAHIDGQYTAVGLHWGLSAEGDSVMSFVTDGIAGLGQLGVRTLPRST